MNKEEEREIISVIRQSSRVICVKKNENQIKDQEESLVTNKKRERKKDAAAQVKILKKEPVPEYDASNLSFSVVTLSLADLRKALKAKSVSENSKRQLVLIPNLIERSKIYVETAIAIADREAAALPSHGGRNWTCNIVISDTGGATGEGVNSNNGSLEQGRRSSSASTAFESGGQRSKGGGGQKRKKKDFGPLFRWYRGKLELACLPHLLEKIDVLDDGTPSSIKKSMDPLISYKKSDMQERQITSMSTWAWENASYPAPILKRRWLSPDHVIFNSRTSALQHAAELLRRDKLIDRVLFGFGSRGIELRPSKPTKKESLEAGYYRFLRDGLWVVGQEEDWLEDRLQKWNSMVTKNMEASTEIDRNTTSINVPRSYMRNINVDASDEKIGTNDMLDDFCDSNEDTGKSGSGGIKSSSFSSRHNEALDCNNLPQFSPVLNFVNNENTSSINSSIPDDCLFEIKNQLNVSLQNAVPNQVNGIETKDESRLGNVDLNALTVIPLDSGSENSLSSDLPLPSIEDKKAEYVDLRDEFLFPKEKDCNDEIPAYFMSDVAVPSRNNDEDTRRRTKTRTMKHIAPSNHWRLAKNEIDSCSETINDVFHKVMYTVKMKQMNSELADGFDIIRERGRGRYDLQIPAFDDGKFDFLTNLQSARWMPVIRQILGDDATLVHKGSFLSLPGSDAQVYHQDGPHLTTKNQRPCHAVNVFIPLVDLHEKNGPTEFCLGTHILGYEYYSKEMLYTPMVKAGTPIIFDYRLGHRGLGNSSDISRPIVYLTYTSASKDFRDQINFSTKRYKKFGEILELPISREERARKRSKIADDNEVDFS